MQMGIAGRQKVETKYCTRVTAPRLARILERVIWDKNLGR